jgi:hypothetical protein
MPKKPWRPVQVSEETGRFTRQQIEEAVRVVRERSERRTGSKRGASSPGSGNGTARPAPSKRAT